MDTKFIMTMLQDSLPNKSAEIQAINDKLDALDDDARREVAFKISAEIKDTYIGVLLKVIGGSILVLIALWFVIEWQWVDRLWLAGVVSRFVYEYYYIVWIVLCIEYIAGFLAIRSEIREANLKAVNEILHKTSHK